MIRFFCPIDDTSLSQFALSYMDALVKEWPVLLVGTTPPVFSGGWRKHTDRLLTRLEAPYVNVVCGQPSDWYRLWTAGVKNVLILGEPPPPLDAPIPGLAVKVTDGRGRPRGTAENPATTVLEVLRKYTLIGTDEIPPIGGTVMMVCEPRDIARWPLARSAFQP